jgi:hypothetical protein
MSRLAVETASRLSGEVHGSAGFEANRVGVEGGKAADGR